MRRILAFWGPHVLIQRNLLQVLLRLRGQVRLLRADRGGSALLQVTCRQPSHLDCHRNEVCIVLHVQCASVMIDGCAHRCTCA